MQWFDDNKLLIQHRKGGFSVIDTDGKRQVFDKKKTDKVITSYVSNQEHQFFCIEPKKVYLYNTLTQQKNSISLPSFVQTNQQLYHVPTNTFIYHGKDQQAHFIDLISKRHFSVKITGMNSMKFSQNNQFIVFQSFHKNVHALHFYTLKGKKRFKFRHGGTELKSGDTYGNLKHLVLNTSDKIKILYTKTNKRVHFPFMEASDIHYSPDGKNLLFVNESRIQVHSIPLLDERKNTYELKSLQMIDDTLLFSTIIKVEKKGSSLKGTYQTYNEERLKEQKARVEALRKEELRLAAQARVLNEFAVSNFGIYNCDRIYAIPQKHLVKLNMDPKNQFKDKLFYHYQVFNDQQANVIRLPYLTEQFITLSLSEDCAIFVLLDENKVGIINTNLLSKIRNEKTGAVVNENIKIYDRPKTKEELLHMLFSKK